VGSFAAAGVPTALDAALRRTGITAPFAIQAATLADALAGEHLLARARTGSGKTLAFGVPLLSLLAAERRASRPGHPRGLVLVPTRELAQQVADALRPLAGAVGLRLTTVYGGTSLPKQVAALARGVDVVVATPGRLTDLVDRRACHLDAVTFAVVDEADHMCDLGFLPVVRALLAAVPADGQRLMFSATLDGAVDVLAREFLPDPVLVAVDPAVPAVHPMAHHAFEATDREGKVALLAALAGAPGRNLFFTRTKHGADRLARQLSRAGVSAAALHGGLAQNARAGRLRAFADGGCPVLVATDVMARGIHVDEVDLVVHADPPVEAKAYLHRSGRTARAGAGGTVVLVSLPEERAAVSGLLRAAGVNAAITAVDPRDPRVSALVRSA